eukprot:g720.t1
MGEMGEYVAFVKDTIEGTVVESLVTCLRSNREHILLLLFVFMIVAILVDSANANLPWMFQRSRYVYTNLDAKSERDDLKMLRKWSVSDPNISKATSTHWWYATLPEKEKSAFQRISLSKKIQKAFHVVFPEDQYEITRVDGMDEIYATGPPVKGTSDEVFYTKHIDGPFMFFRFASVYRCLVGLDDNTQTVTKFPMIPDKIAAQTADVFGFDFNREIHFIEQDPARAKNKEQRIVMKIHYAVYPKILRPWGKLLGGLNVIYNLLFRALFLKTIQPKSVFEDLLARFGVVGVTKLVYQIEMYVGYNNIMYIAAVFALSVAFDSYAIFLALTSFVHYVRYITTYYNRDDVAYGDFKRDVLLFKSLALVQLAGIYLKPFAFDPLRAFEFDPLSVGMIAVGYAVSVLATKALGVDRTYFGVELGFCKPVWISEFPYGTIPHPMIVSQVVALLGFFKCEHMRESAYVWLVPVHVGLYLTHMLQEIFDVHGSKKHGLTPQSGTGATTTEETKGNGTSRRRSRSKSKTPRRK